MKTFWQGFAGAAMAWMFAIPVALMFRYALNEPNMKRTYLYEKPKTIHRVPAYKDRFAIMANGKKIFVFVGTDPAETVAMLHTLDPEFYGVVREEWFEGKLGMFFKNPNVPVIWIKEYNYTHRSDATILHESVHAALFLFNYKIEMSGGPEVKDGEEDFCYLADGIFYNIMEMIKGNYVRRNAI